MLLMGKSTISMAIFNSYVCLPEGSPTVKKNIGQIVQQKWTSSFTKAVPVEKATTLW